jgi:hypothetical protein
MVSAPSRFVVLEDRGPSESARVRYRGFEGNYYFERESLGDCKSAGGTVHTGLMQAYTAVRLALRAGAKQLAAEELALAQTALDVSVLAAQDRSNMDEADALARKAVRLAVAAEKLAHERALNMLSRQQLYGIEQKEDL